LPEPTPPPVIDDGGPRDIIQLPTWLAGGGEEDGEYVDKKDK
jgi:hypothetical protein